MSDPPSWLPPLLQCNGEADAETQAEAAREVLRRDFQRSSPRFHGLPVICPDRQIDHPLTKKNPNTGRRAIHSPRVARAAWVRAVIENAADPVVSVWAKRHGRRDRWCLWMERQDYLVVLEECDGYYLLITAHVIDYNNKRRDLRQERSEFRKRHAPP